MKLSMDENELVNLGGFKKKYKLLKLPMNLLMNLKNFIDELINNSMTY
jgi:hypothetical protein